MKTALKSALILKLEAAGRSEQKRGWQTQISGECVEFIVDALDYYRSGESSIKSVSSLHRSIVQVVRSDFQKDESRLPTRKTFIEWVRLQVESRKLEDTQRPKQRLSTKKPKA